MQNRKQASLYFLVGISICINVTYSAEDIPVSNSSTKGVVPVLNGNRISDIKTGVGCGKITVKANETIQIQSSNFGVDNYFNNEACTWIFTGVACSLSIYCPCFDIRDSFGCFDDYLKIANFHFQDKFCGDNRPVGLYRADDNLILRFKSDYRGTAKGFLCYVRCTPTGFADPPPPMVECPNNSRNPYGVPL